MAKSFSPEGERFAFLEESAKNTFGTQPKLIVRAPQAGDEKIKTEQSPSTSAPNVAPKAPLIPSESVTKEVINEAVELKNTPAENKDSDESQPSVAEDAGVNVSSNTGVHKNTTDASFHSEVNMVMDLFEGKIIE